MHAIVWYSICNKKPSKHIFFHCCSSTGKWTNCAREEASWKIVCMISKLSSLVWYNSCGLYKAHEKKVAKRIFNVCSRPTRTSTVVVSSLFFARLILRPWTKRETHGHSISRQIKHAIKLCLGGMYTRASYYITCRKLMNLGILGAKIGSRHPRGDIMSA